MKQVAPMAYQYEYGSRQGFLGSMIKEERRLSAQIDSIKTWLDIEKLIGRRPGLKRVNGRLKGFCFNCGNNSFMVSIKKDEFHCKKCHIRGDIVEYVAQVRHVSIEIAAQILETYGYLLNPKLKANKESLIAQQVSIEIYPCIEVI
jgi:ribosomal protein S27AE